MFDVFTEEIEVLIKDGIANLYWYKGDLHKALIRSGVSERIVKEIVGLQDEAGRALTKRKQMDALYDRLRNAELNRRLEVSRNLVRILIEQNSFSRQDDRHRVEVAETAALKLREVIRKQEKEIAVRDAKQRRSVAEKKETYDSQLSAIQIKFTEAEKMPPQKRGYALEEIFTQLMRISGIDVHEPFKIVGEQFDGAIKHEGHHYLIEIKWTAAKTEPIDVNHFYMKVNGKMEARGVIISMAGFTSGVIETLPRGKDLKVMLLDGVHIANVIYGQYRFVELINYAISQASLKGNMYCATNLKD
jgi:hypothetical protein